MSDLLRSPVLTVFDTWFGFLMVGSWTIPRICFGWVGSDPSWWCHIDRCNLISGVACYCVCRWKPGNWERVLSPSVAPRTMIKDALSFRSRLRRSRRRIGGPDVAFLERAWCYCFDIWITILMRSIVTLIMRHKVLKRGLEFIKGRNFKEETVL